MDIPCKKCLLADIGEHMDDIARAVALQISSYPADKRLPEPEYQSRLDKCRSCDELISGVCQKCGCFVELRALKPDQRCPHEVRKW